MTTDHSPPADAVEAGCGALWPGVSTTPARVAAVLSAAHAAGTIRWESEYREAVAAVNALYHRGISDQSASVRGWTREWGEEYRAFLAEGSD